MDKNEMLKAKDHPLVIAYEKASGYSAIYKIGSTADPVLAERYAIWAYNEKYVEWLQNRVIELRRNKI